MKYAIRKTYGPIASGTRVELVDPNSDGFENIAKARGGYVTVRLPHMSKKFMDQDHPLISHIVAHSGAFDIEADNLVTLRDRHVPADSN